MKNELILAETRLDDFEDISGWKAVAADGVKVELAQDTGVEGLALRIDFDFTAGGGFVLVRKPFALPKLPPNFAFRLQLRGAAPPVNLEFKLVDKSEKNVWWYRQLDMRLPEAWRELRMKKPRIEFAWGPLSGGPPRDIAFIEIAVTGAEGDKGSLWVDELALEERKPPSRSEAPPRLSASTSAPGEEPERVLDEDPYTRWKSGSLSPDQWLQLDFGGLREYGGLIIDWDPDDYGIAYEIQISEDGERWHSAFRSTHGNGGRDYVYLPEGESRYLRLDLQQSSRDQGYGIRRLTVKPLELAASPNQFFQGVAAEAAPGTYPKYFGGKQSYWTVIGAPGDSKEALINEEGMVEIEKGGPSIEPFLYVDGHLVTWNDAQTTQALEDGYLPIPTVTWRAGDLGLTITAVATGAGNASALLLRYRLENLAAAAKDVRLYLAVRPFQVLPLWQTLNIIGGVSEIHDLLFDARTLWVNRHLPIVALTPPARAGVTTFDEGQVTEMLSTGELPERTAVTDPVGFASAAMEFPARIEPQAHHDVYLAVPFHDRDAALARLHPEGEPSAQFDDALARTAEEWRTRLGCVEFQVPPAAEEVVRTVKSQLAYIEINRNGPILQPGSRTYTRAWIRDGAMTSAALLEMGFTEPVRDFIRWYARYQYADGKIPCCVDRHGPDPLPEHDSNGEFLYAIAEYYRYTRDIGFVHELWPAAVKAVDYLERLRGQRLTDEYKQGDKQIFYGILPESVSHEGYASHPVHSYFDDFFAVRGLKDAAYLAVAVDDPAQAQRNTALRDGLISDLQASIERVIAKHQMNFLPASADLADFDPSSSSIALVPAGMEDRLPAAPLRNTFLRYYEEIMQRQNGTIAWDAYAPYELRNIGVLVRLGERQKAHEVLAALMSGRRPAAWNQWAEVVWRDPAAPKFIGDMPHTWVGSGFIQSARDLFAYERESDATLVVAAGLPLEWVKAPGGVGVKRLATHWGVISYAVRAEGDNGMRLQISGDLDLPPGGIELRPPLPAAMRAVAIDGQPVTDFASDHVTIRRLPADVLFAY